MTNKIVIVKMLPIQPTPFFVIIPLFVRIFTLSKYVFSYRYSFSFIQFIVAIAAIELVYKLITLHIIHVDFNKHIFLFNHLAHRAYNVIRSSW